MKTLIATCNSVRHRYFTQVVSRCIDTPIVLEEEKQNDYRQLSEQSPLVRAHSESIAVSEKPWFADAIDAPCLEMRLACDLDDLDCWLVVGAGGIERLGEK